MPLDITDLDGEDLFLALETGKDISLRRDELSPYHPTSPWIDTSIVFLRHEHTCTNCGTVEAMINPTVFLFRMSSLGTHYAPIDRSITNPEKRFAHLPVEVEIRSSTAPFCTQCCSRESAVLAAEEGEVIEKKKDKKELSPDMKSFCFTRS